MKVLVLYRPRSEHRAGVEEFLRVFKNSFPSSKTEVLDVDQRDGSAIAALYDVMSYPSILVLRDDGSIIHSWEGEDNIPRLDDIASYATGEM